MKHTHVSLITYATEECLRKVINEKSELIRFASCAWHDKDLKEDGSSKEPHHHVNLWLVNPREIDDICKWFKKCIDSSGCVCNTRGEFTHRASAAHYYLTHSGDSDGESDKYQYDKQIIKVLRGDLAEYIASKTDTELRYEKNLEREERAEAKADDLEQELNDIIEGKPLRYMARQYGRDYIKNRKAYHEYASQMVLEETGDINKSCAVLGVGYDQLLYEERSKAHADGLQAGLKAIHTMVAHDVQQGATYNNDLLKKIEMLIQHL